MITIGRTSQCQIILCLVFSFMSFSPFNYAQCPTALGDEVTYGSGSWIGYVYDQQNDFSTVNYQGFITETELFDESFCGNNCSFATNGCSVTTENFSVRYKMRQTFTCGIYEFTIGADDGGRLSIDGGATYIIDDYSNHGYRTTTVRLALDGSYDMVLDYYDAGGQNRVSFNYVNTGLTEHAGTIEGEQDLCSSGSIDPNVLTSFVDAFFCSGVPFSYQWESSTDNITFTDIIGATSVTYDPPILLQTTYFRRKAIGSTTLTSNTVMVLVGIPQGDEVSYGSGSWIGYVYSQQDNFLTANYRGFITETELFNETFCGGNCIFSTNGCAVQSESFSVRFRMNKNFPPGDYEFIIGGDDGVRLSLDGGATYALSDYTNHGYRTTSGIFTMNGSHDLVFDYFEGHSANRVSFDFNLVSLLSVELVHFNASLVGNNQDVRLDWETETETDNDFFSIEKSKDGINWNLVGVVDGAGNSTVTNNYSMFDKKPLLGVSYYRLKQTDKDGTTSTYSDIVAIERKADSGGRVVAYPNPVRKELMLMGNITSLENIKIYDVLGKNVTALTSINRKNTTQVTVDLSSLVSGHYFVMTEYQQIKIQKY